jgi:mannonate dehydratase
MRPSPSATLGGLTPTRTLVATCELFGMRTAPHGQGDVSPVAQAANVALGISSPALGVQAATLRDATLEVSPGAPVPVAGRFRPCAAPGLGVDSDETAARRYPVAAPLDHDRWAPLHSTDGSAHRP